MLTDEDKARIEAEEKYRAELRGKVQEAEVVESKHPFLSGCLVVALCILGILIILPIFSAIGNRNTESVPTSIEDQLKEVEINVAVTCRNLIKKTLKAPATAQFPRDETSYTYDVTSKTAIYKGVVDAQNGFGALIRNSFECSYTQSTNTVKVLSLE
jgi:hypothetical protein